MANANRLRYIECEIPDNLALAVNAFQDEFDDRIKPYFDRLDFLTESELPGIKAALDLQIGLRKQLLEGSPVPGFGSLEAIEANLKLTNPERDDTRRDDERKLGAYNILMLRGKIYKTVKSRRLEGFRYLWQQAGGNFSTFVDLAEMIFSSPEGSLTFLQWNTAKPKNAPFMNRSFSQIYELSGFKPSLFKNRVFWHTGVVASAAHRIKLESYGFSAAQITNILAREAPNAGVNLAAQFKQSVSLLASLSKLLLLPEDDLLRQPRWQSESDLIEIILRDYLEYRLLKGMSSSVLDPNYYALLMQNLTPADLKELFEERPEILDFALPQSLSSITDLVNTAISMPSGSSLINTYMLKLPDDAQEKNFECRLFDVGLALWKIFAKEKSDRANSLEVLLQELVGKNQKLSELTPFCVEDANLTSDEIATAIGKVPTSQIAAGSVEGGSQDMAEGSLEAASSSSDNKDNKGATGALNDLVAMVTTGDNPENAVLIKKSLAASSAGQKAAAKAEKMELYSDAKQPGESPGGSGMLQGRPTKETAAMLLARTTDWANNFAGCSSVSKSFQPAEASKTEVVDSQTGQVLGSTTNSPGDIIAGDLGTPNTKREQIPYTSVLIDGTDKYRVTISDFHELNEGTSITVSDAQSSILWGKFYPKVPNKETLTVDVQGSPAPGTGFLTYEYLPRITAENASAEQRKKIVQTEGKPTKIDQKLEIDLGKCVGGALAALGRWLDAMRKKIEKWLEQLIEVIRQVILTMQEKIDAFILKFQLAMDTVLSKLEKLLSLDYNLSAKGGFENSVIKCVFGVDLSLKINLLELLLSYLGELFDEIGAPMKKFLDLIRDFILNIFCIPIKYLESILGGADEALADLSELTYGLVQCSIKDFKLPGPIFELLQLLNGLFNLRSLVLRQASGDWGDLALGLGSSRDEFSGLSQFAAVCQSASKAALIRQMSAMAEMAVFQLPTRNNSPGMKATKKAAASAAGIA